MVRGKAASASRDDNGGNKLSLLNRIREIRMGGAVERCHTVRHLGSYSVAAHSWGVAVLMYVLWPEDFPRLAIYCLVHDVPEGWVGDAPATIKAYNSVIKAEYTKMERGLFNRLQLPNDAYISPEDRAKLKACDHLELYLWADEQWKLGNHYVHAVIEALNGFFKESPLPEPALSVYRDLYQALVWDDDILTRVRVVSLPSITERILKRLKQFGLSVVKSLKGFGMTVLK